MSPDATARSDDEDFYEQTRFWRSAKDYGLWSLLGTWASALALLAGGLLLGLYLSHEIGSEGLKALSVAYISLAAALFGIVLAGFAVVATFFDPTYVRVLRDARSLMPSLFGFWWVAALTVASLLLSVALTTALYAHASRTLTAVVLAAATIFFVSALLEALSLVGTLMRHGLYRAEWERRQLPDSPQPQK
jgi:hypothetical protein